MRSLFRPIAWILLLVPSGIAYPQAVTPSIKLADNATLARETENASVDLQGIVSMEGEIVNLLWADQLGGRGSGTWVMSDSHSASWTVTAVPLHLGVNLISIIAVDAANNSQSLPLTIRRTVAPGSQPPPSLEVHNGVWQNRQIAYQVRHGTAVLEGDIILGPEASLQGSHPSEGVTTNGFAVSHLSALWPSVGGVHQVPYVVSGSSANLTTAISAFNSRFTGVIQFVPRSTQSNYVQITVGGGGTSEGFSSVGMVGGAQALDCGSGCPVATWLHEIGHTVGLWHEHQRPDRDGFVTFNLLNADLPKVPNLFAPLSYNGQITGLYDYASLMHFSAFAFSSRGAPVLESSPPGIPLSNSLGYSAGDIDQIDRLYGATPASVTVTTNPVGLGILVDGTTFTAPHSFTWSLNSTHTLAMAPDPQYTSPADGSTYQFAFWNDLKTASHTVTIAPGTGALTSPPNKPAVTVYQANFVRLQPFAFQSPAVLPSNAGIIDSSIPRPSPLDIFGGKFYADRTQINLQVRAQAGSSYNFYKWINLPAKPATNFVNLYIQAPLTHVQALFVSTPVTVIGAAGVSPATDFAPLSARVDGNVIILPTAFTAAYDGPAWNPGTTHTLTIDQVQSPLTPNLFYNWNSWDDGGAMTHTITQPPTGVRTKLASLTPFFATYTVPPPLGGSNSACYGGVTNTPAGVSNPANPAFLFYADGTDVTSTATPNAAFPYIKFSSWTGSILGMVNPQTNTVHKQFVPIARFNTVVRALSIDNKDFSASASSGAFDVAIQGSGFTGDTKAYWDGSLRSISLIGEFQLYVHLNAGDLATAGGHDLHIGNYNTNASGATCEMAGESRNFEVKLAVQPPTTGRLSPTSGSGAVQTFTAVYSDPYGISDLNKVELLVNNQLTGASACYVTYLPATNALHLENDGNTGPAGSTSPGSSSSISNSQCTLSGSGTSVSTAGNSITVKFSLSFTNAFFGLKNVYLRSTSNGGNSSNWVQWGTWITDNPATTVTVVSLTPSSGQGMTQAFQAVYSDSRGATDLTDVRILFNNKLDGAHACYLSYNQASNKILLRSDANDNFFQGLTPGAPYTISNSQCVLSGSGSTVSKSGNDLIVTYTVTLGGSYTKNVYLNAFSADGSTSGWVQKGTWDYAVSSTPTVGSVTPILSFAADYSDPSGVSDLSSVRLLFNTVINGANACYVYYVPGSNALYLQNDANTAPSAAISLGSPGSVSNSQCTLSGLYSTRLVSTDSRTITVNFALSFKSTFSGPKNIYVDAISSGGNTSGWIQKGTWTPGQGPPPAP